MSTRLVATCWAESADDLVASVARAARQLPRGHLVEARLDLLARPLDAAGVSSLARAARGRLLVTCREGGTGSPPGSDRLGLIGRALAEGAAGCDLDAADAELAVPPDRLLVLSDHGLGDPSGRAAELASRAGAHRDVVVKVARPVESAEASLALARAVRRSLPEALPVAPVALGPGGTWMRLLAGRPVDGRPLASLAYVAAERPLPGPCLGQPLLREALDVFGVPRVNAGSLVFAVIGWPLRATWSPALHGALFGERGGGTHALLVPMPVRTAEAALALLGDLRAEGAAVTMPHKESVRAGLRQQDAAAHAARCVNTLRRNDGWEGFGFDGAAARWALERAMGPVRGEVVILGAGGAARACAVALREGGADVTLIARDAGAARRSADLVGASSAPLSDGSRIASADVLVNATPCGGAGAEPLPTDALPRRAVLDMVTTPHDTALLRAARARGLATADGLCMLAHQAHAQQRTWGFEPGGGPEHVLDVLRRLVAAAP